ncbi:MAG: DUF4258 domain-containing protein [Planctomycetes bacterium]|nr:DUF4258 domain-containing protein [Planctomycetota bacterium]
MEFRLSRHAQEELQTRGITLARLEAVMHAPEQVVPALEGRAAYQSRVQFGGSKVFLLRVIVDTRLKPALVVTVYRTSKIEKYWRTEP